jgi:hypothetical protein
MAEYSDTVNSFRFVHPFSYWDPNGPKGFPDYSTFIVCLYRVKFSRLRKYSQIFVEESPPAAQVAGAPEFDDP